MSVMVEFKNTQSRSKPRPTGMPRVDKHTLYKSIRDFCVECVGYMPTEVKNCTSPKCPLFKLRPYQEK